MCRMKRAGGITSCCWMDRGISREISENRKRPVCYDDLWQTKMMVNNAPRDPGEVVERVLYACPGQREDVGG